jgi:PhnB protein
MSENSPKPTPRITPYLYYEDVSAALSWLAEAFGFKERFRMPSPDGKIAHAEMELADGVIMMGCPNPDYRNPARLGQTTQSLYVYVDNVDALFARAKAAGAKVIQEPKDQFYGDRNCGLADPEGHTWYFGTHIRDVPMSELLKHG